MKSVEYHSHFLKSYKKRIHPNPQLTKQFAARLELFFTNRQNRILKDHPLSGRLAGKRAFSISGDIRVIYKELDDVILLLDVGTHNQVYK